MRSDRQTDKQTDATERFSSICLSVYLSCSDSIFESLTYKLYFGTHARPQNILINVEYQGVIGQGHTHSRVVSFRRKHINVANIVRFFIILNSCTVAVIVTGALTNL